jgi:hypothetical protein
MTEFEARSLLARHFRLAASAVNIEDWPTYLRRIADGHEAGEAHLDRAYLAPEPPEPGPMPDPGWIVPRDAMGVFVAVDRTFLIADGDPAPALDARTKALAVALLRYALERLEQTP